MIDNVLPIIVEHFNSTGVKILLYHKLCMQWLSRMGEIFDGKKEDDLPLMSKK